MPLLLRSQADGREIDVLYGVPFAPPALARIADLNRVLQSQAAEARHSERSPISVLIDHPRHLDLMLERGRDGRGQIMNMGIFIKIDTGYHRAGVAVDSQTLRQILDKCPHELMGDCPFRLRGFYSHLGHSYGFSTPAESIEGLMTEIRAVRQLAIPNRKDTPFILSVGATPTVTSAQNLLALSDQADEMRHWNELYNDLKEKNCELELHAGVYPLLDMQQVATGARPSTKSQSNIPATLSTNDIAIRILVEVASVYEERTNKEALITAGSLALGREPCKSYPGWGVVAPWRASGSSQVDMGGHGEQFYDPAGDRSGWIVGRVSQEHGLLTLEAGSEAGTKEIERLKIGDKLLIWPNHACIAAAAYGWYYVVDSESDDKELVRDVWVRWRGW